MRGNGPNDNAVTSALEIASNTSFPRTGAAVRAVPFDPNLQAAHNLIRNPVQNVVSGPGQTYWKGAKGVRDGGLDLATPPLDILLECIDRSTAPPTNRTVRVTWDMSCQDFLDELHYIFGRACTFTTNDGRNVTSEEDFDGFCSWLEKKDVLNTLPLAGLLKKLSL